MSIHFYITVFVAVGIILLQVNSQNPIRQYVIRKDFFNGFKATELSVYDSKEKHLHYRIESQYSLLQNIQLIAYPSKQKVGTLKAKIKPFLYKAEFSFLNSQSNRWINGQIEQNFKLDGSLFSMRWNGHRISMRHEFGSFTSKFYDTDGGQVLAQFRLQPASILWARKYDMRIFSNKYPEQIYLLALAARDNRDSQGRGR